MKSRHVWTAILLVIFASQLAAQGIGIGPQVGIYKTKDADESSMLYGAMLRMKLSPSLGIEGAINYRSEEYLNGDLTLKTWPIMATILLYPLPILPVYGAIGAGWYNYSMEFKLLDETVKESSQEFGYHFGVGVELPLGGMKLTGDVRYVFLNYEFKDVPGKEVESNFYVIMIGVLFGG